MSETKRERGPDIGERHRLRDFIFRSFSHAHDDRHRRLAPTNSKSKNSQGESTKASTCKAEGNNMLVCSRLDTPASLDHDIAPNLQKFHVGATRQRAGAQGDGSMDEISQDISKVSLRKLSRDYLKVLVIACRRRVVQFYRKSSNEQEQTRTLQKKSSEGARAKRQKKVRVSATNPSISQPSRPKKRGKRKWICFGTRYSCGPTKSSGIREETNGNTEGDLASIHRPLGSVHRRLDPQSEESLRQARIRRFSQPDLTALSTLAEEESFGLTEPLRRVNSAPDGRSLTEFRIMAVLEGRLQ